MGKFDPHPNKRRFTGILAILDEPSDSPPMRTKDHRVVITREAARLAINTLPGMGLCIWKEVGAYHNPGKKIGVIDEAYVIAARIHVEGYIYKYDFPDAIKKLESHDDLGMSWDICDAQIEDTRRAVWNITRFCFTGACVLPRKKAAYGRSFFELAKE